MLAEHFLLSSKRARQNIIGEQPTVVGGVQSAYFRKPQKVCFTRKKFGTLLIPTFYCIKYTYLLPWVLCAGKKFLCSQVELPYYSEVLHEM